MATITERIQFVVEAVTGNAQKNLKGLENQVTTTGQKIKSAWSAIGTAAIAGAGAAIAKAEINAASNLAESSSKAAEIFGRNVDKIQQFAEGAAQSIGQSQRAALDAASAFAILGEAGGLAGDDLVSFSTDLTTLAADLASFNNTSVEDAATAISAGLRGENEPLRRYGVLLDDATLKAEAMAMGIYDGTGALTQQQKILASHSQILKQTTTQQGDFARTADGAANSQRRLGAELENLAATFGEDLAPGLAEAAGRLSQMVGMFGDLKGAIEDIPGPGGGVLSGFLGDLARFGTAGAVIGGVQNAGAAVVNLFRDSGDEAKNATPAFNGLFREAARLTGQLSDLGALGVKNIRANRDTRGSVEDLTRVFDSLADGVEHANDEMERAARNDARNDSLRRHREAADRAADAEERLAAAIRDRTQAALDGTNTILDMADAQADLNSALDEWKREHHEAVFAAELGLDPAAEAEEASQALRDAARAALRVVEQAAQAGTTEVEKAQLAAQALESILAQAPWLRPLLAGTLGNLQTATQASVPMFPSIPVSPFTALSAPSIARGGVVNVTINNPPGTDGRQVARGFEDWTRVNGTANTSGLP